MNQDQVKALLLRLRSDLPPFEVIFSGKSSVKVDGLYKPDTREILLHNRNFTSEDQLVYTAIHELAHHIHFCSDQRPTSAKAHTNVFWDIFHRLLIEAEAKGLYRNIFQSEPEFAALTEEIKTHCLKANGQLMKDFGQMLLKAWDLCKKHRVNFEDYMDRILNINRVTARWAMKSHAQNIVPDYGFDTMKILAGVGDPERRRELVSQIEGGFSGEMIKADLKNRPPLVVESAAKPVSRDRLKLLERERARLRKHIDDLQERLKDIDREMIQIQQSGEEL